MKNLILVFVSLMALNLQADDNEGKVLKLLCSITTSTDASTDHFIEFSKGNYNVDIDPSKWIGWDDKSLKVKMNYNPTYESLSLQITDVKLNKVINTDYGMDNREVNKVNRAGFRFTYSDDFTDENIKDPTLRRFILVDCERLEF